MARLKPDSPVVGQLPGFKERQPGQRNRPAPRPADGFPVAMQENGIKPGGQPARLIVARQAFPGLDQRFRNEVFGRAQVAGQGGGLPQQARLQRFRQKTERPGISGAARAKANSRSSDNSSWSSAMTM